MGLNRKYALIIYLILVISAFYFAYDYSIQNKTENISISKPDIIETTTQIETISETETTEKSEDEYTTYTTIHSEEPITTKIQKVTETKVTDDYENYFSENLRNHAIAVANGYGLDPATVFGVIEIESNFNVYADSGSGCVGLMQISTGNYSWLHDTIGITDLREPYQNIQAGCYILYYYVSQGYSIESALVAYNTGGYGTSSWYSRSVLEKAEKYR